MTLSFRHRIRNSSPGGLRPSTLPLGHGGSPQYWVGYPDTWKLILSSIGLSVNTKYLYNICTMWASFWLHTFLWMGVRFWRWSNIVIMLYRCCVFAGLLDVSKPAIRFYAIHIILETTSWNRVIALLVSHWWTALCHVYQNKVASFSQYWYPQPHLLKSYSQPFKYPSSLVVGISDTWQIGIISKMKVTYDTIEPVPPLLPRILSCFTEVGSPRAVYSSMERISFIIHHKHSDQSHPKCPLVNFLASTHIVNCNVFLVFIRQTIIIRKGWEMCLAYQHARGFCTR